MSRLAGGYYYDTAAADPDHEFFCPMHPTVVRDTNKEKCPICFMPLSKRKKGEAAAYTAPNGNEIKLEVVEAKPFAN